jgi:hypothetical protein
VASEEQDVHADHDGYHREHVKRDGYPVSHRLILVSTTAARLTRRPRLDRDDLVARLAQSHTLLIPGARR